MGLFSFIKAVGEKIGGKENDAPQAEEVKKSLDALKLGTDGVQVRVDGDKVILSGVVKDRDALEKVILAAGNNKGVAQVDSDGLKAASGQAAGEPVLYVVKKGDTLSKIAEEQYGKGNANKYPLIFEANKPMLASPDRIYPGQTLRIPPLS